METGSLDTSASIKRAYLWVDIMLGILIVTLLAYILAGGATQGGSPGLNQLLVLMFTATAVAMLRTVLHRMQQIETTLLAIQQSLPDR